MPTEKKPQNYGSFATVHYAMTRSEWYAYVEKYGRSPGDALRTGSTAPTTPARKKDTK